MAAAAPLAQSATMLMPREVEAGNTVDEELNVIGLEAGIVFDGRQSGRVGIGRVVFGSVMEDFVFHGQFSASGSLKPSAPKSLMPLSRQGLCEAEMTTPA
jgi:hypothetical protein